MGFWGVEMLARTAADVAATTEVESWHGEIDDQTTGSNGWQSLRLLDTDAPEPQQVAAVAREAGGPVLVAYVLDSDCAAVTCAGTDGTTFDFYLRPEVARRGYDLPADPVAQAAAPARLLAWAGPESGADLEAIRAVLAARYVFAEDAVLALAAALGAFPTAEAREMMFGEGETIED